MNLNRKGEFVLSYKLITERPELVTRIMDLCIIVRAEPLYVSNRIVYHAYSNRFDEVEEGVTFPTYEWIANEDGSIKAVKL